MSTHTEFDENSPGRLEIHFKRKRLSLSDIGIVSSSIDYMLNKTGLAAAGIPLFEPLLSTEDIFFLRFRHPDYSYPALVIAEVTDLTYGSFSVKSVIRPLRIIGRDVTGILIATLIIHEFSLISGARTNPPPPILPVPPAPELQPNRPVDLGPNIVTMTKNLSATGEPWELSLKDTNAGTEVIIKGNEHFPRSHH